MYKFNLGLLSILTVMAFGGQAMAQDCRLSSDCDGSEVCVNQECIPDGELDACTAGSDCDHMYACIDGNCKPEGIYCKSETGYGIYNTTGMTMACGGGLGIGGASMGSDVDCAPNEDCDPPSVYDLTPAELDDLYAVCVNEIERSCGTEVPVPAEDCSPEALQICTDWFEFGEKRLEECEDEFGAIYEESHPDDYDGDADEPGSPPSVGSDSATDGDIDEDVEEMDGGAPDEEIETSGDAGAAPSISGLFSMPGKMRGLAEEANPWQVVECCESFDEAETENEAEMLAEVTACFMDNNDASCADLYNCVEPMFDYYDYGDRMAVLDMDDTGGDETLEASDPQSSNGDDNEKSGDGDGEAEESDDDESGADADDSSNGGSSGSGCSIASPGATPTSPTPFGAIISLIF